MTRALLNGLDPKALPDAMSGPAESGLLAQAFDPCVLGGQLALAANGTIYGSKIYTPIPITVTNLHVVVGTAGATLTSGQNFAALYSGAKALLRTTADQSTPWVSTGVKTMAVTSTVVPAGYFYVVFFANGTTRPALARGGSVAGTNGILSAANARFFSADTGRTTSMPATLGSFTAIVSSYWCGVS